MSNDIESLNLDELASLLVKTYNSPAKGRKPCKCGKYVGVRTSKCVCGYDFAEGSVKVLAPQDKYQLEAESLAHKVGIKRQRVVLIGAGKCPVALKGLEPEDIEEWCQLLLNHGRTAGLFYSPSAIRYYLGQFYNVNTQEYKIVVNHLNSYLETIQ